MNPSVPAAMQGLHLVADLQACACAPALLSDAPALALLAREAVLAAGLTVVGEAFHRFPDAGEQAGGVTGTLLLAESHVALHTWPEFGVVTLDVYVCNYSADNTTRAEQLMDALLAVFQPAAVNCQRLLRCVSSTAE
ncbi:adenosylmethionine decarboxylase [Uliginosibacterium sp. 31-16]|uniref:adenosylmethionine decarboxylase n=1 Tax=Uliginosibacterium sp. 31-16 TaxID=3068315 RepID=UPI00273E532C|nr:adenosylmethionine decarboxylase [Uliginosibacterium sp. 31-16]MDP5241274.1 adenosylmethionine decarboxylase [Uliginosibacterium sp. 31-16]